MKNASRKHGITKPIHKSPRGVKSEKISTPAEETPCAPEAEAVSLSSNTDAGMTPATQPGAKTMDVTLTLNKNPRKSTRLVIFDGPLNSVQFLRTAFGPTIPETITVSGDFAEPKAAKVKETKEEKKARLAALPKPTLAEKVARAEKRADELKAKLAKSQEAPAA